MQRLLLLPQGCRKWLLYSPLSILLLVSVLPMDTANALLNPYQIKAVFLFNFSKFVTWPESSLSQSEFTVCVLGKDPFGVYLDLTLEGTQADQRPIRARRMQNLDQLNDCPLLFISTSKRGQLDKILAKTDQQAILTVSDIPDFARRGGGIELYNTQQKTGMIINQTSIERAGLSIRANLLQLADIIR